MRKRIVEVQELQEFGSSGARYRYREAKDRFWIKRRFCLVVL
jgi:hypothetical protein